MTDIKQLTTSLKQKLTGIQSPNISGFGKQVLFEDGPLYAEKLLIIPDFYTSSKAYMPIINALSKLFRIAIFDLPGHFGSTSLVDYKEYKVMLLFKQLVDFLGWYEFNVYAHGSGCIIASALQENLIIKRIIYACPTTHMSKVVETTKRKHKGCRFVMYYDFTDIKKCFYQAIDNQLVFQSVFGYFDDQMCMIQMDTDSKQIQANVQPYYEKAAKKDSLFLLSENDVFNRINESETYFRGIGANYETIPLGRFQFADEEVSIIAGKIKNFFNVKSAGVDGEIQYLDSTGKEEFLQLKVYSDTSEPNHCRLYCTRCESFALYQRHVNCILLANVCGNKTFDSSD